MMRTTSFFAWSLLGVAALVHCGGGNSDPPGGVGEVEAGRGAGGVLGTGRKQAKGGGVPAAASTQADAAKDQTNPGLGGSHSAADAATGGTASAIGGSSAGPDAWQKGGGSNDGGGKDGGLGGGPTDADLAYDGALCPPSLISAPTQGSPCAQPAWYDAGSAPWTCRWPGQGVSCDCVRTSTGARRWECAMDGGAQDGSNAAYVSQEEADKLESVILGATAAGDICPAGSWTLTLSEDEVTGTMMFSSEAWSGPLTGNQSCTVTWEMEVPAGYQMAAPFVVVRGWSVGEAAVRLTYSFEGTDNPPSIYSSGALPDNDSFAVYDPAAGQWSPSCAASQRVRFITKVEPSLLSSQSLLAIHSIDTTASFRYSSVDWRACGSTEPVKIAPGTVRQYCAGVRKRACAAPLACELSSLQQDWEGKCVDPNETMPPGKKDDPCGGVRHIQCENDLVCRYLSQEEIDHKITGTCSPRVSDEGEYCTTVPQTIPCKSGLYCVPTVFTGAQAPGTCAAANGEKGSWCGASGMPSCQSDLVCSENHKCTAAKGKLGASCSLPTIPCDAPLQCEQNVCSNP